MTRIVAGTIGALAIVFAVLLWAVPDGDGRLAVLAAAAGAAAFGFAVLVVRQNWQEAEIEKEQKCLEVQMLSQQLAHPAELRGLGEEAPPAVLPLEGVSLRGAALVEADLRNSDLRTADLQEADLRGANLNRSDLRGADLRGAQLSGAELNAAVYDRETRWPAGLDPRKHTEAIAVEDLA